MTPRLAAASLAMLLAVGGIAATPTASALPERPAERFAAGGPKVGTYEGEFGPKGNKTPFTLDVVKRNGRLVVTRTVAFYRCSGSEGSGDMGYSTFSRVKVRNGRFSKDSIIDIQGRFKGRRKVVGKANPAPGLFGCTGKPQPFKATYVGRSVSRGGTYAGTDATGAPVSFTLEADGKVLDELAVTRRLECGNHSYGELFGFGRALVRQDGTATATLLDDFHPATFTYSLSFDAAGAVSGTYRTSSAECDTGEVAFTARPAS